ncbi:SDR family NAD(P)-dependent oxidoreductase [Rhodococcus jostii]|uniref:SDR family NAD(P)-dependent oxidoreductase n=1 Tax=Rhodococcus jostii TaxID=132919 RepID=UPI0036256B4E
MGTLGGKTALVSGSGRGIGREIALKLAREGAAVVVNDLDPEPASQTVDAITASGGRAVACAGSVSDNGFAERFVDTAVEAFGGLDIIVNNAGYTWDSVIQKMTDEQWDTILDVNLKAPFRILRAAQPFIKSAPTDYHRKVVNISSVSGFYGNAGQANYGAAKAGLLGLTKTLAKEWGRYKVNVNAVAFGLIITRMTEVTADTDTTSNIDGRDIRVGVNPDRMAMASKMIPFGRGGTPAEAAGAVYLLCTPESDYINSQCLVVDAGRV